MKYSKMTLTLVTMLFANQPAQALNWESFKWENINKKIIAGAVAIGTSFTAAYWLLKKHNCAKPIISQPAISQPIISQPAISQPAISQPNFIPPFGSKEDDIFQNLAYSLGINVEVKYLHTGYNVEYKGHHSNSKVLKIDFNPFRYYFQYIIEENNSGESESSIIKKLKEFSC